MTHTPLLHASRRGEAAIGTRAAGTTAEATLSPQPYAGDRPAAVDDRTSVLLVDDQPAFRTHARTMFERDRGFKIVSEAGDGADAVQKAGQCAPDVILMDVRMPVMTGIEATRRILARHPETNIILISISAEREYSRLAHEAGARAFISKRNLSASTVRGAIGATSSGDSLPVRS